MLVYTKYHRKSDRKQKTYKKIYVLIETFEERERVNAYRRRNVSTYYGCSKTIRTHSSRGNGGFSHECESAKR